MVFRRLICERRSHSLPEFTPSLCLTRFTRQSTEVALRLFCRIRSTQLCVSIIITVYEGIPLDTHQSPNQSGPAMPSAAGAVREPSVITQRSITSIECQHSSHNYINIIRVVVLLWQVLAVQPLVLPQPCVLGRNS